MSVKNSDWAGFVDANGMQSGKEQGLQLDAYPSGQTALYLVVQNSTEAVKYIQITSVVMENKGKKMRRRQLNRINRLRLSVRNMVSNLEQISMRRH